MCSKKQLRRIQPVLVTLLVGATMLLTSAPAIGGDKSSTKDELIFEVTGLKNARGKVRCALYNKSKWLEKPKVEVTADIKKGKATCSFVGVKSGTYGLAAYHDEDGDGKLDTNFVGIPSEGLCASRNATGSFGPPDFDDAKFRYKAGRKKLSAKMVY